MSFVIPTSRDIDLETGNVARVAATEAPIALGDRDGGATCFVAVI